MLLAREEGRWKRAKAVATLFGRRCCCFVLAVHRWLRLSCSRRSIAREWSGAGDCCCCSLMKEKGTSRLLLHRWCSLHLAAGFCPAGVAGGVIDVAVWSSRYCCHAPRQALLSLVGALLRLLLPGEKKETG